jgi:ribonuclease E
MTDPLDSNDDWAELARELDRDKPPAPPPTPPADMVERLIDAEAVEPHHGDPRAEEEAVIEGEPEVEAESAEEFDDAEEGAPTETGEQPGTGRKRRRRRRRRRKGGGAQPEGAVASENGEESELEPVAESETDMTGDTGDYESVVEDFETSPMPLAADEDTASEVLRDLIANWNVPSWDDIVGGLYRPG